MFSECFRLFQNVGKSRYGQGPACCKSASPRARGHTEKQRKRVGASIASATPLSQKELWLFSVRKTSDPESTFQNDAKMMPSEPYVSLLFICDICGKKKWSTHHAMNCSHRSHRSHACICFYFVFMLYYIHTKIHIYTYIDIYIHKYINTYRINANGKFLSRRQTPYVTYMLLLWPSKAVQVRGKDSFCDKVYPQIHRHDGFP